MRIYPFNKVHPLTPPSLKPQGPITEAPRPERVILPLSQHIGAPAEVMVKIGEAVKTGTKIADSDKFISSPIHSSISGTVSKIDTFPHPVLGEYLAVVIDSDRKDQLDSSSPRPKRAEVSADDLRQIIREAGIVGQGGAAFPTQVKLSPPEGKAIDTVILNGAECEPYLGCDAALMTEKPAPIIEGLEIISRIVKAERAIIAIEDNKPEAIKVMRDALIRRNARFIQAKSKPLPIEISELATQYPMGAERTLIKKLLSREVPSGELPFEVGVLVQNVGTALAVYEAVNLGRPLYERVISVTGDSIEKPQNLKVRIGTPIKELIDFCRLKSQPDKIIFGGPMMGIAQYTDEVPVLKGTTGVIVLSKDYSLSAKRTTDCIRCSRCLDSCPAYLEPAVIAQAAEAGNYEMTENYKVSDCVECGACSYVCPARIDLIGWIKLAKIRLKTKDQRPKT